MSIFSNKKRVLWSLVSLLLGIIIGLGAYHVYISLSAANPATKNPSPDDSVIEVANFNECLEQGGRVSTDSGYKCQINGKSYDLDVILPKPNDNSENEPEAPEVGETETMRIKVYFTSQRLLDSDCGGVQEVTREIPYTRAVARASLLELFKGPSPTEKDEGLIGSFTSWQEVLKGVEMTSDGTLLIDFKDKVLDPNSPYL
jgi:spore germination protein GerM